MEINKKNIFKIVFFAFAAVFMIVFVIIGLGYRKKSTAPWSLKQFSDDSGKQGTFYILENNNDGTLIVIDGGTAQNARKVRNEIRKSGGKVDAWFITHFHDDHVEAFNEIYADPGNIEIKKVYTPAIDRDMYMQLLREWDDPEPYKAFMDLTEGDERIVHPGREEVLDIDGLKIEILSTFDDLLLICLDENMDPANDISMVFKVSGEKDSLLFLGDFHTDALGDGLIQGHGDKLKSEFVQAGHHGNNSLPERFYEFVSPRIMLFDAPEWLMTEDEYTSKDLAAWCDDNGIERYDFTSAPNVFDFE